MHVPMHLRSSSLILTVAVQGFVVSIAVLFSRRTVPTVSSSQAISLLLKCGMQRGSMDLPALNCRDPVRVPEMPIPRSTLSAGM